MDRDVQRLPVNAKINLLLLSILIRAEMEAEKDTDSYMQSADTALGDINMRLNLKIKDTTSASTGFAIPKS